MSEVKFNAKSGLIILQGKITGTKGGGFYRFGFRYRCKLSYY